MIWSTILSVLSLSVALVSAHNFPDVSKRHEMHLATRGVSDPCCKSCGPIGDVLVACPLNSTDIFCGCDQWVANAPICEACIVNALFNTSFALNPGPSLEIFWAFCQCGDKCRKIAEALFAPTPCNYGQDGLCAVQHLASPEAEECACCLESTDEWFATWFKVEIELAKEFLDTGIDQIPGSFHPVQC